MMGAAPAIPTRPPHVLMPTSGPIPAARKSQGIMSPPEPAYSLMIMTLGP
jgi:hypothetical protein